MGNIATLKPFKFALRLIFQFTLHLIAASGSKNFRAIQVRNILPENPTQPTLFNLHCFSFSFFHYI